MPFPDYPGEANPDGPAANHRVADDGTFRAIFVADRATMVGALYLAAFCGPGGHAPHTRPATRP
ncbi:MAG: hypothetical protein OXG76_01115 [Acidimicrobiaceae bacterium]|nr:hypothetical protein [Acidimicrobiaceae bacterium]